MKSRSSFGFFLETQSVFDFIERIVYEFVGFLLCFNVIFLFYNLMLTPNLTLFLFYFLSVIVVYVFDLTDQKLNYLAGEYRYSYNFVLGIAASIVAANVTFFFGLIHFFFE